MSSINQPDKFPDRWIFPFGTGWCWCAFAILTALIPVLVALKYWRAQTLSDCQVAYFPDSALRLVIKVSNLGYIEKSEAAIKSISQLYDSAPISSTSWFYDGKLDRATRDKLPSQRPYRLSEIQKEYTGKESLKEVERCDHYWAYTGMALAGLSMLDRFDDLAFINTVALALCVFFLIQAREHLDLTTLSFRSLQKAGFLSLLFISLALLVYLKVLDSNDSGPIHGYFFTHDTPWTQENIPGVAVTQRVDYVLFMVMASIGAVIVVAFWRDILFVFPKKTCEAEITGETPTLIAMNWYALIASIPLWISFALAILFLMDKVGIFSPVFNGLAVNIPAFALFIWVPFAGTAIPMALSVLAYNRSPAVTTIKGKKLKFTIDKVPVGGNLTLPFPWRFRIESCQ